MKKLLVLVMLALSVCCTAFAYHTPNREELNTIQSVFGGYYNDIRSDDFLCYIGLNDDGSVSFYYKDKEHYIKEPNLQVDFNDGLSIVFYGNCSYEGCDFQGWRVCFNRSNYQSRVTYGEDFNITLLKNRPKEEIVKGDVSTLFYTESYAAVKI